MTHLIDKDALVAEIERRIKEVDKIGTYLSPKGVLTNLLCHLDTLEVKEAADFEFEKEIDEWLRYGPHTNYPWCTIPDAIKITAEHFFELGLKA